ncbi:MAG: MoaD/ThiS family protein, partial [Anaerolineae bacterium]
ISLAQASFARYIAAEMTDAAMVARALSGWHKLLTMHQHLMSAGYHAARALDAGDFAVLVSLYGRLRALVGADEVVVRLDSGARAEHLLRKFFNYFPETRGEVFDEAWEDDYRLDDQGTPWIRVEHAYRPRRDWNIRLNGRNLEYAGGLTTAIQPGDRLSIFPPGR